MKLTISDTDIRIDGVALDGQQIEALVARLAQVRAVTAPEVTRQWAAEADIDVCSDPALKVGMTREGRLLMALRHSGFGWCNFDFGLQAAAALQAFIAKRVATQAMQGLDDIPHTDRPH